MLPHDLLQHELSNGGSLYSRYPLSHGALRGCLWLLSHEMLRLHGLCSDLLSRAGDDLSHGLRPSSDLSYLVLCDRKPFASSSVITKFVGQLPRQTDECLLQLSSRCVNDNQDNSGLALADD